MAVLHEVRPYTRRIIVKVEVYYSFYSRLWLRCHGDFIFGVGEGVVVDGVAGEGDAIEGLGEGVEGLLAAVGLELTLPDGDAVPSH